VLVELGQQHHLSVEKVLTQYFLGLLLLAVVVENLEVHLLHYLKQMVALAVVVMERAQYLTTLVLEMVILHQLHHLKVVMVVLVTKLLWVVAVVVAVRLPQELLEVQLLAVMVAQELQTVFQAHLLPMRVAVVVLRELELQVLVALEVVALAEETLPISMVVLELLT
jgi:hypothetical protein